MVVNVGTFVSLVLGGLLHYAFVDKPAIAALETNKRLTEKSIEASQDNLNLTKAKIKESTANVELAGSSVKQNRANALYLTKNVERMDSDTTKSSETLGLEKQRIDEAREIDELLQSLVPNVQINLSSFTQSGQVMKLTWKLKNLGTRGANVNASRFHLSRVQEPSVKPAQSSLSEHDYTVTGCQVGHILPGQSLECQVHVQFRADLVLGDKLGQETVFTLKGLLDPNSKTEKILRAHYDDATLRGKLSSDSAVEGTLTGLR